MKFLVVAFCLGCAACAERPQVGIIISNTPEPIESCGRKIGGC